MNEAHFLVHISDRAIESLDSIFEYISNKTSPESARKVVDELISFAESLDRYPNRFPKEKYQTPSNLNIRSGIKWKYKILYEVWEERVIILDFFHTAQNPTRINDLLDE